MHSFGRLPKFYNAELRVKLKDLFGKAGSDIADVVEPILGEQKALLDQAIKTRDSYKVSAENNGFLAEKFRKEVLDLKTHGYRYVVRDPYPINRPGSIYAFHPDPAYDYKIVTHAEWTTKSKDLEAQLKAVQAGADYWFDMWTKAEDREKELKERNAEQAKTILKRGVELANLGMETKSLRDELNHLRKTKLAYRTVYSGYPYN